MKNGEWLIIDIPEYYKLFKVRGKKGEPSKSVARKVQMAPVSDNHLYATNWKTKRRYPTSEAKKWKSYIRQFVYYKGRPDRVGKGSEMYLEIFLTFPSLIRKRDPQNYTKAISDALKGILWDDDQKLKTISDGIDGEKWQLKIKWGLKEEL